MSTISKQWLQQKIADMEATRDDIPFGLGEDGTNTLAALRIALASIEAEPYGYVHKAAYEKTGSCGLSNDREAYRDSSTHVAVYTAPPAPVSDEDLLHMAASAIDDLLSNKDRSGAGVWADIPAKLRRAAMLQGADGTLIGEGTITATQFKPVADLYGLTSPTGGETSFTFDAVEARDFIDGGWSCQEYVELGRFQEVMLQNGNSPAQDGNYPVVPDGWVVCSERMPEQFKAILAFNEYGEVWSGAYDRHWNFYCDNLLVEHVTHWMPLPNPPKE